MSKNIAKLQAVFIENAGVARNHIYVGADPVCLETRGLSDPRSLVRQPVLPISLGVVTFMDFAVPIQAIHNEERKRPEPLFFAVVRSGWERS